VRLPRDWLDGKLTPRWRVPLGDGYAAPVVAGDRVFTFGRVQDREVVQVHELATGKVCWRYSYPAPFEVREIAHVHGAGPNATPVVFDGRLYVVGITEIVHCLDAETGRVQWRIDFPRRYGTSPPGYGACSSPVIHGRRLLVPAAERVAAVDARGGGVAWRTTNDSFYSSLVVADLATQPQVVAFTRHRLVGLDGRDGRMLWSHPCPSMYGSNVATPCVWQDRIIISSPSRGTRALCVRERAGRFVVEPVWQTRALRAYLSSPVVSDGYVYGVDESGQLVCLSAADGRTAWAQGNFGDYSSLVLAGDQLLILSDSGDLAAVEATPLGYRPLGEQQVADSATWTHLVLAQGCMLVRDRKRLTCFELPAVR
jgi:outer membrane protein assembly factor BamB